MNHKNEYFEEYCWCDQCKEERRVKAEYAKQETAAEATQAVSQSICAISQSLCAISHQYCQKCGHCIDCGNCTEIGCGEGIVFAESYVTAEAFRALKQDYEDAGKELVRYRRQVEQQGFTIAALHNDCAAYISQRDNALSVAHFLRGRIKEAEAYIREHLGG